MENEALEKEQPSVTPRWLRQRTKMMFPQRPCHHYSYIFLGVIVTFLFYHLITEFYPANPSTTEYRLPIESIVEGIPETITNAGNKPPDYLHFTAPRLDRVADTSDVFARYKNQDICHLSSLDLHIPFEPLCPDRSSMLRAMSWGGRPGQDAPYIPYGCDMRFYTPEEICSIMSRFDRVILMGDSIVRHLTNALWIIMRGDIGYGGLRRWDMMKRIEQGKLNTTLDCACGAFYSNRECNSIGFRQRDWILKPERGPVAQDREHLCGADDTDFPLKLTYQIMLDYPLNPAYLKELVSRVPAETPDKPVVFVMGHELWNDVDVNKTEYWMDQVLDTMKQSRPSYAADIPKLYLTTNAGGENKPARWLKTQSINKMAKFEHEILPKVEERGIEFLGMYNMSVQATSTDGTHADLKTNLLKAMMVLNWLDKLDTSNWKGGAGFASSSTPDSAVLDTEEYADEEIELEQDA